MNKTLISNLFITLAFIGFSISFYLAIIYSQPLPVVCTSTGIFSGCEDVRQSSYAHIFGISTPALGAVYFTILLLYTLFKASIKKIIPNDYTNILLLLCFLSFLFESFLTYVQITQIKALCMWCLIIELIVFIQLILAYLIHKDKLS